LKGEQELYWDGSVYHWNTVWSICDWYLTAYSPNDPDGSNHIQQASLDYNCRQDSDPNFLDFYCKQWQN